MKKSQSRPAEGRSNSKSRSGRKPDALREQAERRLSEKSTLMPQQDAQKVLHELEVHQIQLEMQNETLRHAQNTIIASQQRYAELYDFAPIGYFTFDHMGLISEVNLTGASLLGVERGQLKGKPFSLFVAAPARDTFHRHYKDVLRTGTAGTCELQLTRKGGVSFYASVQSVPVRDAEGKLTGIRSAISDITDRKQAEDALRASEEHYHSLFNNMLNGFAYCKMLFDQGRPKDFTYLSVNSAFEVLTGLKEVTGRNVSEVIPGIRESDPELFEIYGRVALTGTPERFEKYVEALGMWFSISVYSPRKEYFVAVFDVITERKQAEARLAYLASFPERNPQPVIEADLVGRVRYMNEGARRLFPDLSEQGLTHPWLTDWATAVRPFREGEATTRVRDVIFDGRSYQQALYYDAQDRFVRIYGLDVTERKQAESRLQRETAYKDFLLLLHEKAPSLSDKELYDYVLEETVRLTDSAIGFFHRVSDDQKTVVLTTWNSEALKDCTASYETHYLLEQAGNWVDCVRFGHPVIYNDFPHAPNQKGLPDGHVPVRRFMSIPVMEGDKVRVIFGVGNKAEEYDESDALQIQLVANALHARMKGRRAETALRKAHDELELRVQERTAALSEACEALRRETEERRHAEEQLLQAQKMEAVGTLAGGIAHDFNNILAAMIGFSELAADDVPADSKAQRHLKRVHKAGLRGRELVRQILTFSRKTEGERKQVSLTPLVHETHALLRSSLPTTIQMPLAITTSDDYVLADPTQIQQVLMNLATNASHAMQNGGQLTIGVSSVTFPPGSLLPDPDMGPGAYVKLTVKDTGCGMTEEVRQRIFEPFFTTKEIGKGTGMGLAVVYGIVKSHGGAVTVQSEVGQGSVFAVFLPWAQKPEVNKEEETTSTLPAGTERILFVDDEEMLVEMARDMLESLGYHATVAKHPTDAWNLFLEDPSRFDLVITDQTMPDTTGITLAQKIMRVRKEMPIILCTGYSETVSAERAKEVGISAFLMKPVVKRELAETIRRVLDGRKE